MSQSSRSSLVVHAIIALVGTLAGLAVVGYYALSTWMSPATPLAVTASAVLLPLIALNVVVALLLSGENTPLGKAIGPPLLVTLLVGGLGVGASTAWYSQQVRQRGLDEAANRDLREGVVAALDDPSDSIVARACTRIFEMGIAGQRQQLLALMDRRPDIARSCLSRAAKRLEGTNKDTGQVDELAKVLGERWHERLLAEDRSGSGGGCTYAKHLEGLPDPARKTTAMPALLSCTIRAPNSEVKNCCGQALQSATGSGEGIVDALGTTVSRTIGTQLAPALAQASLHQLQMEDAEKARMVKLGLTDASMRRWTMRFGCSYLLASDTTNELVYQFTAWLDSTDCAVETEPLRESLRGWQRTCTHVLDDSSNADPDDVLCKSADTTVTSRAFQEASDQLHAALGGAEHSLMNSKIAAGTAMKNRQNNSRQAAFRRLAERLRAKGHDIGTAEVRMKINRLAAGKLPDRRDIDELPRGESVDEILGKLEGDTNAIEALDDESAEKFESVSEQIGSDEFKERVEKARERFERTRE